MLRQLFNDVVPILNKVFFTTVHLVYKYIYKANQNSIL
jgi:hypothetical protein